MSTRLIRLDQIHLSFDKKQVLRALDLEIGEGETFAILGGSGIGKSVTLKLLIVELADSM